MLLSFWEKVVGIILPDLLQPQKAVNPLLRLISISAGALKNQQTDQIQKQDFISFSLKLKADGHFFCFSRPNIQENVIQQHSLKTTYIKDCSQSAFRGRLKTFPVAVYQFNLSG